MWEPKKVNPKGKNPYLLWGAEEARLPMFQLKRQKFSCYKIGKEDLGFSSVFALLFIEFSYTMITTDFVAIPIVNVTIKLIQIHFYKFRTRHKFENARILNGPKLIFFVYKQVIEIDNKSRKNIIQTRWILKKICIWKRYHVYWYFLIQHHDISKYFS